MASNNMQIKITAIDDASAQLKSIADSASQSARQLTSLNSSMSNMIFNGTAIAAGIAGFNGLTTAINEALSATLKFSRSMETNQIGIAGILSSMVQVKGRNLDWNEAMGMSKNVMGQLNDEALKTAATSEELVNTFRALLGPGLAAKMTMSEIVQLTSTGVNAVKSLGLNNTQLVQELRDLVQGGIQPASSTLATALGLKDKDIEAAKNSSEGLFKFLMARLDGFKVASEATQNTFSGKLDQIKEGLTRIGSEGSVPLFDAMKNALGQIGDSILIIDQTTKNVSLNPNLIASLTEVSNVIIKMGSDLKDIWQVISVVVMPAIQLFGEGLAWVAENTKIVAIAFGTWTILSNIVAIYTDVIAVAAGATTANTLLGGAVLAVRPAYMEQMASAELAAEIEVTAARAAMMGNIQLAEAILATQVAYIEQGMAAEAASATAVVSSLEAGTAVKALTVTVLTCRSAWLLLAAAIAGASYALVSYQDNKDKIESANKKAEVYDHGDGKLYKKTWSDDVGVTELGTTTGGYMQVELSDAEYGDYEKNEEGKWQAKKPKPPEFKMPEMPDLNLKFPSTDTGKTKDTSKAAERAYEEAQRMTDKIADMMARMNERILSETGTTYQNNIQKLQDDVDNMNRELDKNKINFEKYGIDVSAVQTKITEYQAAMTAKYKKEQERSLNDLKQTTIKINSEIVGDVKGAAEAEYQSRLIAIQKEKEQRYKASGDIQAALDWEVAATKEAERKKLQAIGEGRVNKSHTTYGDKLYDYNTRYFTDSQKEVSDLQRTFADMKTQYSGYMEEYSKNIGSTDVVQLFQQNANGLLSLNDNFLKNIDTMTDSEKKNLQDFVAFYNTKITALTSKDDKVNFKTGFKEAYKEFGTWSENMVTLGKETAQAMQSSFQSFFFDAMTGQLKSFGDYIKSFLNSIAQAISKMMANALAQKAMNWIFPGLFKADGGPVLGSSTYLVGEHGPELFTPYSPGSITPTTKLAGATAGGTPNMVVNVYNNSGQQVDAQQTDIQFDGQNYVLGVVIDGISKNKLGLRDMLKGR